MSNKDDNWVIYVVLPVPILGTYYTMYPIFWQIQNRGSRVIYQRPLVMFWQGRWQGRNWSISGTAWSSGVCKIWITVTSCCYCGMKNTPALYTYFLKLLSLTLLWNRPIFTSKITLFCLRASSPQNELIFLIFETSTGSVSV